MPNNKPKKTLKYISYFTLQLEKYITETYAAVAILTALLIPVLIGFAALSFEVGQWLETQQHMQQIADVAAYAAGKELSKRGNSSISGRATYLASQNGFNADSGSTIVVNNPPASGPYTSDKTAVEVLLTKTQTPSLTQFYSISPLTIQARSVSRQSTVSGCVFSMNKTGSGALTVQGSSLINTQNCSVNVNSSSSSALSAGGGGQLTVNSINIVGNYSLSSNSAITTQSGTISTGASPITNPYSNLTVPAYSSCNYRNQNVSGGGSTTLNPGVYCGGLSISSQGSVTFNPGVYIIDGGSFSITGGATVTGKNVTIILSGQISGTYATAKLTGSGSLTLEAPTSGQYQGVAILQDPKAPSGVSNTIAGTSSQVINGIIAFPNQALKFAGGSTSSAPCTVLVADTITFTGNTNTSCPTGSLGGLISGGSIKLVE